MALEIERRIDRREPALPCGGRDAKTFGDLIRLHQEDLREVGKSIGRSKAASLALLNRRLGAACAFLCSTHAAFIVGQNIVLDGGASNITL